MLQIIKNRNTFAQCNAGNTGWKLEPQFFKLTCIITMITCLYADVCINEQWYVSDNQHLFYPTRFLIKELHSCNLDVGLYGKGPESIWDFKAAF